MFFVVFGKVGCVIVIYGEVLFVLVCILFVVCIVEFEKGENFVDMFVLGDLVCWGMEM